MKENRYATAHKKTDCLLGSEVIQTKNFNFATQLTQTSHAIRYLAKDLSFLLYDTHSHIWWNVTNCLEFQLDTSTQSRMFLHIAVLRIWIWQKKILLHFFPKLYWFLKGPPIFPTANLGLLLCIDTICIIFFFDITNIKLNIQIEN